MAKIFGEIKKLKEDTKYEIEVSDNTLLSDFTITIKKKLENGDGCVTFTLKKRELEKIQNQIEEELDE